MSEANFCLTSTWVVVSNRRNRAINKLSWNRNTVSDVTQTKVQNAPSRFVVAIPILGTPCAVVLSLKFSSRFLNRLLWGWGLFVRDLAKCVKQLRVVGVIWAAAVVVYIQCQRSRIDKSKKFGHGDAVSHHRVPCDLLTSRAVKHIQLSSVFVGFEAVQAHT
ncbi:hypothetical protein T08_6445 [Trichinella sp. T8]|nr:hypothetical protein T08_6445 [Trichinella sp. T8]